jgi:hypothetical protein
MTTACSAVDLDNLDQSTCEAGHMMLWHGSDESTYRFRKPLKSPRKTQNNEQNKQTKENTK